MSTQYISYSSRNGGSGGGVPVYPNFAAFPATATDGQLALAQDTDVLYAYNAGSGQWVAIGGPGNVLSIGTYDSKTGVANGAQIVSDQLFFQSATASVPGMVNTGAQTLAGAKTFTGAITASNLSGTNSGDVTLGTASGLSLSGQALSLALSSTSTTGALSSTDWNTFNNKQPAGTYVTAITVASANGLAGTSSGGATPALTLSTSVTGILKGNGTAISAAVAGDFPTLNQNTTGSAGSVSGTNVITNSNLAQMATLTLKGNNTGGTANAADLTVAQVNAILPAFTSTLKGLVPASGGGTTTFLRADGTFATPATGTGTVTSVAMTVPTGLAV